MNSPEPNAFKKSDEWHKRRLGGIGGSEVAAIIGVSPYRTAYDLWLEKTGRKQADEISHLPHVQRGILGEEVARMIIEREELKRYIPKQWKGEKEHWLCSDDGYQVDDEVILEIKCMGKDNHAAAAKGVVPPYYLCQVQWNLMVSKARYCKFISFRPEDETMHTVVVHPDPAEQARIAAAVDAFWMVNVKGDVPPPMTDKDAKIIDRPELVQLLQEYERVAHELKRAEAHKEELKEKIKPYVVGHPIIATPCGYKVSLTKSDGVRVSYPGPARF